VGYKLADYATSTGQTQFSHLRSVTGKSKKARVATN
jgi:hypothetical protein